jgi:nitroreductase
MGLDMPLREAMQTQRSIRRLRPDPVDDDVLFRCLELATRAPTGGNNQSWHWVVVRDPDVKAALARSYRQAWRLYGRAGRILTRGNERMRRILDAVQWQVDHFEEVPVVVVACLEGARFGALPIVATTYYGSIYPAVQNFLLACRAEGLGAGLVTLPLWSATKARRALGLPFSVQPAAVVPVGWPRGRYGPTTRKPLEKVVHLDRFGNHPEPRQGASSEAARRTS